MASDIHSSERVWDLSRTSTLRPRSPMPVDWVCWAHPDPPGSLPVMVERLRALTSGPFGVDLICANTGFGPASTDWHVDMCVQLNVPLVVFHHDPPPDRWVN